MDHPKQSQPIEPKNKITGMLPFAAGLLAVLFLLGVGTWYLLDLGRQPGNPVDPELTAETLPSAILEEAEPSTPTSSFFDDFEDGLDPVWAVHYGDPFTVDGQLTSNVGAGLAAGEVTWRNYEVEFDVDATQADCGFTDGSNSLGVRVTNFDRAYWFVFSSCESAWSFYAGGMFQGVENLFADTRADISESTSKHITIKVQEQEISAYVDRTRLSSLEDTSFATGGIFLQVEPGTLYDNFRVTLLP